MLGKIIYWYYEFKILWKQLGSVRVHETVWLSDGAVGYTDDVSDFYNVKKKHEHQHMVDDSLLLGNLFESFSGLKLVMPCILQPLPQIDRLSCYKREKWIIWQCMTQVVLKSHCKIRFVLKMRWKIAQTVGTKICALGFNVFQQFLWVVIYIRHYFCMTLWIMGCNCNGDSPRSHIQFCGFLCNVRGCLLYLRSKAQVRAKSWLQWKDWGSNMLIITPAI